MPIHIASTSRRAFLKHTAMLAAGATLAASSRVVWAADSHDANFIALLSDTHIPSAPSVSARDVNMTDNLNSVISQIGKLPMRPGNLFINGDCAYLKGLKEDYQNLAHCLTPLDALGIDLHLTMGNHDDRPQLYGALSSQRPAAPAVSSKHLSIVECEFANWFLLDSLSQVDVVTGELGDEQRSWLAKELDARRDKPAVVMAHHNPQFTAPEGSVPWTGIADTAGLFEILDARPHVRAFIYGHTHAWGSSERKHMKLINLPPVAYVFSPASPNGWVSARMSQSGLSLQLQTLDPKHPKAGEIVEIAWK